jgi:hypothetical protein
MAHTIRERNAMEILRDMKLFLFDGNKESPRVFYLGLG